jgi:hypothetical protein
VTDAFAATYGGTPQSVHVIFHAVEKDDWVVAGRLGAGAGQAGRLRLIYRGQRRAGVSRAWDRRMVSGVGGIG